MSAVDVASLSSPFLCLVAIAQQTPNSNLCALVVDISEIYKLNYSRAGSLGVRDKPLFNFITFILPFSLESFYF